MLEALFEVFFRVLKHAVAAAGPGNGGGGAWSRAKMMRRLPLLYPSLEGLARCVCGGVVVVG
jgi:hypothetical protein